MTFARGRRTAAAVAGGALVAGTLAALAPAPSAHAESGDPGIDAAVTWLDAQLGEDGLFTYPDPWNDNQPTTDVSATIDAGLSVVEVGGDEVVLDRILAGVEAVLPDYLGDSAGRYGKAAHFLQEAGADATDAAGIDLIGWLEDAIDDETGLIGEASTADTYAYVWIVRALDAAGSADAEIATDALIDARCDGAGWGYEYDGCVTDLDATAWVVSALAPQAGDAEVDAAIEAGLDYISTQQAEGGGYGDFGPNSNSTGLVASAFAATGEDEAATAAADWVRARQLSGSTCDVEAAGDGGAIAYIDQSLSDAVEFGIGETSGEWILATAQATPALQYATPADAALAVRTPRFARPGATMRATVTGVAPGARACLSVGSAAVDVTGTGAAQTVALTLPKSSRRHTTALAVAGQRAATRTQTLGKKRLGLRYKKVVQRGAKPRIVVAKLAPGERVAVRVGKKVTRGKANPKGRFVARVKMSRKGLARIKVRGQYANRAATGAFRVR